MMSRRFVCLCALILWAAWLQGCGSGVSNPDPGGVGPSAQTSSQAYAVGLQAYIWGYPVVDNQNRFIAQTGVPELMIKNNSIPMAPINKICFLSDYISADEHITVCPNHDTIYGFGWLDLSIEPVVIRVPDLGTRYWNVQLCDYYTNIFASPGTRWGSRPGDYLVVGPDWNGKAPPGTVEVLRSPTHRVWATARVLMKDRSELPTLLPQINHFMAFPLSELKVAPPFIDYAKLPQIQGPNNKPDYTPDDSFWDTLRSAISQTEIPPDEQAMVATFLAVLDSTDPAARAGLAAALADGKKAVQQAGNYGTMGGQVGNHWTLVRNGGDFGHDYLGRAGVAYSIIYLNLLEDAAYYNQTFDGDGNPLDGARRYQLHFNAAEIPPCDPKAFWSVTLYGSDFFLVPNSINRYNVGTVTQGLQYNNDGSLDLYLQSSPPAGHESNWLPTPASGAFLLTMRVYIPGTSVLQGTYVPPPVKQLP